MRDVVKIFFILFVTLPLYAEDIGALLGAYQRASELSNKTKDENAGNLILYTRSDLERMQAKTLKDLLKSMPFFYYTTNRMGQPDIMNADPITYYSHAIRVYLDEHELLDPIAGSGFILFGNMELDFIDHVEIYQGFPSFDFGMEPAMLVIHLYSKTPEHDSGARLSFKYGSNDANQMGMYGAQQYDDLSVFAYLGRNDDRYEKMPHDGETLRRDLRSERLFASLESGNHRVQIHAMQIKGDAFMGSLLGAVPESASQKNRFLDLSLRSYFQDKSLTLTLSLLRSLTDIDFNYNDPAYIPNTNPLSSPIFPVIPISSLTQHFSESGLDVGLKKEWLLSEHDVTLGAKFRYKHFDLTDATLKSPAFEIPKGRVSQDYYSENVYSIFFQDLYTITTNHLLSASVMYQHYDRRGSGIDDPDTMQFRLGYVFNNNVWGSKTFLVTQEFTAEPYMTISPHYGNPHLEPELYKGFTQEVSYTTEKTVTKMTIVHGINSDMPYLDPESFTMKNSKGDATAWLVSLQWEYLFGESDKLILQAHHNYIDFSKGELGLGDLHETGGLARMLNTVDNFDIFNEFIYRNGYYDSPEGIDYSAGVIYHYSDDLSFNIKGENIFNDGLKWSYVNRVDLASQEVVDRVSAPTIEQRFWIGMEYLF